jgi:hypothetical protein
MNAGGNDKIVGIAVLLGWAAVIYLMLQGVI